MLQRGKEVPQRQIGCFGRYLCERFRGRGNDGGWGHCPAHDAEDDGEQALGADGRSALELTKMVFNSTMRSGLQQPRDREDNQTRGG